MAASMEATTKPQEHISSQGVLIQYQLTMYFDASASQTFPSAFTTSKHAAFRRELSRCHCQIRIDPTAETV